MVQLKTGAWSFAVICHLIIPKVMANGEIIGLLLLLWLEKRLQCNDASYNMVRSALGLHLINIYHSWIDQETCLVLLRDFTNVRALAKGKLIHIYILKFSSGPKIVVWNTLINMYAKCGSMEDAHTVFNCMHHRNVFSWTTMVAGCIQHGNCSEAINLFKEMQLGSIRLDAAALSTILNACAIIAAIEYGKLVHASMLGADSKFNPIVSSTLLDMYLKSGAMDDAYQIFARLPMLEVFTWSTMIAGYAHHGHAKEAIRLYWQMEFENVKPDNVTLVTVLNASALVLDLHQGKQIHAVIIKTCSELDSCIESTLVSMYAKCGDMGNAYQVFKAIFVRDNVSCNALIAGYILRGDRKAAVELFDQMTPDCMKPDRFTFRCLLSMYADIAALGHGKRIHASVSTKDIKLDGIVGNMLVVMYVKCGALEEAHKVFDRMLQQDIVSWGIVIAGQAQYGNINDAIQCLMSIQKQGLRPTKLVYATITSLCSLASAWVQGKWVHASILRGNCQTDTVLDGALVDMYLKCDDTEEGLQVFDRMCKRDDVAWNAVIMEQAQHLDSKGLLKLFSQMQSEQIQPNDATFAHILGVCSSAVDRLHGKWLHMRILEFGYEFDATVGSALVDMYAKCGIIENASQVFDALPNRGVIAWSALIGGYAQYGIGKEVLVLFERMSQENVKPDKFSFISVITACSHACLIDEGCHYVVAMSKDYQITPTGQNYACMVDLLGRAGLLAEAEELINNLPLEPTLEMWRSFLGSCQTHRSDKIIEHLINVSIEDHCDPSVFVLLSNVYAVA